jgi:hypothetical protein
LKEFLMLSVYGFLSAINSLIQTICPEVKVIQMAEVAIDRVEEILLAVVAATQEVVAIAAPVVVEGIMKDNF